MTIYQSSENNHNLTLSLLTTNKVLKICKILIDITVGWEIVEICTGMGVAGMGTDIAGIPWGWKWHL